MSTTPPPSLEPLSTNVAAGEEPLQGWRGKFFAIRHTLLISYVLALIIFATLLCILGNLDVLQVLLYLGMIVLAQVAFLTGAPHLTWPRPRRKRAMIVSKVIAAAVAALLTFGVIATAISVADLWRDTHTFSRLDGRLIIGIPLVLWAGWGLLFLLIWTGDWLPLFRRTYKLLIAGTCLELLTTIPVDVVVRKRNNCYCEQGTFYSMVIGVTIAIWSFGPGIVLLFFTRRMQRRDALGYCRQCGYDLRGLPHPRCPECGTSFEVAVEK